MNPTSPAIRIGAACILTIVLALPAASQQAPTGYPRLGFYGSIRGNGYPFYGPDSVLDVGVLDQVSRYDEIILDVNPIWPYRPDVLQALRARNPNAKYLGYVVGQNIWNAYDRDSLVHYPTRYRRIADNNDGRLYDKRGGLFYAGNVNLAKKGPLGNYIVADSLALLWKNVTYDSGVWDGIFFDILCDEMNWTQASGDSIDFLRAGYPSFAEFNQGWMAATDTIAARLRRWCGPNYIMVGNCALGTKYTTFNGWMREGFPYQAGGDWYSNMFWEPGGYMTDERRFLPPRHNYIFSFQVGTDPYSYNNNRIMRFGLGSASLGDGFGVFAAQDRDAFHSDYHTWWFDEFAVDLEAGGVSSTSRQHAHWLGQALSDMYQMIWISDEPDGVTNPDFETSANSGWLFGRNIPATLVRDSTTAGHGRSSAHINIPVADPIDWKVNFFTATPFEIYPWNTYSATFWIKASSPRTLPVMMSRLNGPQVLARMVDVSTEWRQVQIPFYTYANEGSVVLGFYLAKDAGDVWIDDVHFQAGVSNVYRRDFQHGTVLVNTSASAYAQVPMERSFKRILGIRDPGTNDGSPVTTASVAPSDALFLISTDDPYPPATVRSLRVVGSGSGPPPPDGPHQ